MSGDHYMKAYHPRLLLTGRKSMCCWSALNSPPFWTQYIAQHFIAPLWEHYIGQELSQVLGWGERGLSQAPHITSLVPRSWPKHLILPLGHHLGQ